MKKSRNQIGAIGEAAVVLELLKNGVNVLNINHYFRNYKNADLICMNTDNGKSTMIQVKTGTTHNILVGLESELDGTVPMLDNYIVGPWVFVYIPKDDFSELEFYVLTEKEVKEVISTSCKWYAQDWNRTLTRKPMVGVEVKWLQGKGEEESAPNFKKRHKAYHNPLGHNSQNRWDKITALL